MNKLEDSSANLVPIAGHRFCLNVLSGSICQSIQLKCQLSVNQLRIGC